MPKFTEGELKVMRILWQQGPLKPAEIQAKFPEPIKNPALRSYLAILLMKGHVTRRKQGKAYYYQAKTKKESALSSMYEQLVNAFFGGSARGLVCHLIKEERLSEEELLQLKKIAHSPLDQDKKESK